MKNLQPLDLHPIKTESEYEAALLEIESLLEVPPGTPEAARLDLLATLVDAYEREHFPIPLPDPIEAIRFYLESRGLDAQVLIPILGDQEQVNQVLNRQQPLSLEMIRQLHQICNISAEVLIQSYALEGVL
ncbi:MAG: transcriptional regulator [Microcystis wesenbergii Mw_QC_S_20081001_S30D]|jgi:HTH-type transcriptional regulator/antitoxin HigA|uniref:Transcriptional regulator n=1 Tax=Microcystis wesenbergii Mw_QC_S_20081001_S30D TaxID=2486245 RepID=A0A552JDJ8_9CHRO|nr:transcriptional regulator [Microcystis aeruginosa W11-03]NCR92336.1 transcriptional regulator [Microcystis aeruginosa W11-06]TRU93840.1 MAG: transcriptional regulator [Microcystis wesenbergii Mw_QC_S_20081001_S30D]TRU94376.1 MAG: transcriptional regulator [Microcystis wesenbergii Mw_QC_B_20070930_S4D]TRU97326.1 MAG: transcriptional regulator [Microcystis wesenbergii Mw_QC_S_20081001_S30]TRV16208.1 MAG: transcriptional regulator [Microcystis wesenbergii Mw_QC_B_20070930_S4]